MTPEMTAARVEKLTALLDVGKAMSSERNLDRLLRLILAEVTRVMEADRSSIFLVDRERSELWSKIAQGLAVREIRIGLGRGIAGYVARTGEPLNIPDAYTDPRFDPDTDLRTGYQTRNILCAPMCNKRNEVIGVLQVLNKHRGSFTGEDEELLLAFSSQAAAAVENAILYEDIRKLFEGFITASVYAIESRDPTTSGHSERVALLTIGLAEQVDRVAVGPYAGVTFTAEDLRELRYAALLHDFGKVGVREPVLVKANRLHDHTLELIEVRFRAIGMSLENGALRRKLAIALTAGREDEAERAAVDAALRRDLDELQAQLRCIREANRPARLLADSADRIRDIARRTYLDADGHEQPYLTPKEVESLLVASGTLNAEERREIESHVAHSFRFLCQIPWTTDLRQIPAIAHAHHEKLDGSGYPSALRGDDIPLQARMIAICDIYDALTAADRPYKRTVTREHALTILQDEADAGHLDAALVRIFIDSGTWSLNLPLRLTAPSLA